MTRVVVTGMGIASPAGLGIDAFWTAMTAGTPGVTRITSFDPSRFSCQVAGQIHDISRSAHYQPSWVGHDRVTVLSLVAAAEALSAAGIEPAAVHPRFGTFVGTGIGGVSTHESQCRRFIEGRRVHPMAILRVMANAPAASIAAMYGFTGPSATVVSACASSSQAIANAYAAILAGQIDLAIVGGADAPISEPLFAGWDSMRAMSRWAGAPQGACRPFSKDRSGLVLGEGAAFLVLERAEHADQRGATAIGTIRGYATNTTTSHPTAPDADQEAVVMRQALESSGVAPREVVYVHAHGTGTPSNDSVETRALREAFGTHADQLQVSSGKSIYGHPLGAAGATGVVTALLTLRHQVVPPTINLEEPDPACDLNYVPLKKQALRETGAALINAFAFGGTNTVIVASG